MISKGDRFLEKIMLKQKVRLRSDLL